MPAFCHRQKRVLLFIKSKSNKSKNKEIIVIIELLSGQTPQTHYDDNGHTMDSIQSI